MSANNVYIHTVGGYNFYSFITDGKKYIIGGVPQKYKNDYIAEANNASAIILLTSKPEFCGGVGDVVANNPDIDVYATSAGLRNIKEIINRDINECLIKDNMEIGGIKFIIAPNLSWVDTVLATYSGILFSGELFSGDEEYYNENLAVNRDFVKSAIERVKTLDINSIFPAKGEVCDVATAILQYETFTAIPEKTKSLLSIVYSSEYGFTRKMAEYAKKILTEDYDVYFTEAAACDMAVVNNSDVLIIGTNTINRNAPQAVWDVITRLDLVNMRQTPYFVFGSFGWAGDGIKLVDKTLQSMGMKQIAKPVEVLFNPSEKDFTQLEKAIAKLKS